MQDYTVVDQDAIIAQEKDNSLYIDAIERLMDDISMQYDGKDKI